MRLRTQLLVLIGVLLGGVQLLSLAVIYRDVRAQVLAQQSRSLALSLETFRAQEAERFQRLALLARVLEAEPGFRTILRRTDLATLQDHVDHVVLPEYGLDLVAVASPRLQLATDGQGPVSPVEEPVTGYLLRGGKLYQTASSPLYDGEDARGMVTVGLAVGLTSPDSRLQLEARGRILASDFPAALRPAVLDRSVPGYELREASLGEVATLVLGQSSKEPLAFLESTRLQLYLLGLAAVAVALLVSFPLLKRLTRPVERMLEAQAELRAVVEANLDGLVALDPRGRVRLANPAAAVALGRPLEELIGADLSQDFPVTERLVEHSVREREGHAWEVTRTRVRAGAGEVGTLVVLRDATRERHLEERLGDLFERLARLLDPGSLPARNLGALALLERGQLALELRPYRFEGPDLPGVEADPDWLRLVLDNLEANAMEPRAVRAVRDGGGVRVEVSSAGPEVPPELYRAVMEGPLPRPVVPGRPGGLGIGLYVCQRLLELHGTRLELAGTTVSFRLPAC